MANPEFPAESLRPESIVVAAGRPRPQPGAALNVAIELSTTFRADPEGNHYARETGSETTRAFEHAVGALEGGLAVAFASGMAATTAVFDALLPHGGIVVAPWTQYSGTSSLLSRDDTRRWEVRWVEMADTNAAIAAFDGAALVWVETPGNPMLTVADLPTLVRAAHERGALVAVDSTFNTPLVLRPLSYGADVVVHSATKYLSGHSDVLMGCAVATDEQLAQRLALRRVQTGAVPGVLESYLALRGVRTLALRMERAQANALTLAGRLQAHSSVTAVRYPGLPDDPFHERATRLHDGYGAMVSFHVAGGVEQANEICRSVRLMTHATSLGGVETLIERRAMHPLDAERGVPEDLLRLSVGVEHVDDLWADLSAALDTTA